MFVLFVQFGIFFLPCLTHDVRDLSCMAPLRPPPPYIVMMTGELVLDVDFLSLCAHLVNEWVNPRITAVAIVLFLLAAPWVLLSSARPSAESQRHYASTKLGALMLLHIVTFSLVADVGLYTLYRQYRPCECAPTDGYSVYGMPSGDAMIGGIVGAWLWEFSGAMKPGEGVEIGYPWVGRFLAVIVLLGKCFERLVLGYHSLAQVTVGSTLGVLMHVFSVRAPMWANLVMSGVQVVGGFWLLTRDESLVFSAGSHNNLFAWFIWGAAFSLFSSMMLYRLFQTNKSASLKSSYAALVKYGFGDVVEPAVAAPADSTLDSSQPMTAPANVTGTVRAGKPGANGNADLWFKLADTPFTASAFGLACVVLMVNYSVTQDNWLRF